MTKPKTLGEMLTEDELSPLVASSVRYWLIRHNLTDHTPLKVEAVGEVVTGLNWEGVPEVVLKREATSNIGPVITGRTVALLADSGKDHSSEPEVAK